MPGRLRLAQIVDREGRRAVAATAEGQCRILDGVENVRDLALAAISAGRGLAEHVQGLGLGAAVDLAETLAEGRVLAPIDHPDPAHLMVAGTGLTHLGSAKGRDQMHRDAIAGDPDDPATLTDSMRMFRLGLEGGKPQPGAAGVQPEWFYKGDGSTLVTPGQPLPSPAFALDGGEEPEIAGLYVNGPDGTPWRIGFALGNEFSDHVTERQNYLYLAHSKLRPSAIGPEILVGDLPGEVEGTSRILRDGATAWQKPFVSGEDAMSHALANLEGHHFKYALFRRPGDVNVHYFGTATLSVADGFRTRPGDVFEIAAEPFGLPLRNALGEAAAPWIVVRAL